jgi:hypothetical protein
VCDFWPAIEWLEGSRALQLLPRHFQAGALERAQLLPSWVIDSHSSTSVQNARVPCLTRINKPGATVVASAGSVQATTVFLTVVNKPDYRPGARVTLLSLSFLLLCPAFTGGVFYCPHAKARCGRKAALGLRQMARFDALRRCLRSRLRRSGFAQAGRSHRHVGNR